MTKVAVAGWHRDASTLTHDRCVFSVPLVTKTQTDPRVARDWEYGKGDTLDGRINFYQRSSTSRQPWQHWVFDRVDLTPGARVLEVGCGTGYLWALNADRIDPTISLVLTDRSPGILEDARRATEALPAQVDFRVVDAEAIPFDDGEFDFALANHMLFHVGGRQRALQEIARVLRPTGRLIATTIGRSHLQEIQSLTDRYVPEVQLGLMAERFGLETGVSQLESVFARIERVDFPDALEVTDVELLVAFVRSQAARVEGAGLDRLREAAAAEIAAHGCLRVTNTMGLFRAWK
jgi:ubiquinone/menaquinone biosynthesis C-methylase UbiE